MAALRSILVMFQVHMKIANSAFRRLGASLLCCSCVSKCVIGTFIAFIARILRRVSTEKCSSIYVTLTQPKRPYDVSLFVRQSFEQQINSVSLSFVQTHFSGLAHAEDIQKVLICPSQPPRDGLRDYFMSTVSASSYVSLPFRETIKLKE